MTPNAASPQPVSPHRTDPAANRRRSPAAFRGSLERRLPTAALVAEAEWLLPPAGRSEAFAEDLVEDAPVSGAAGSRGAGRRRPRLRWLGLPVLTLGVGATLSLASFSGLAGLVGF